MRCSRRLIQLLCGIALLLCSCEGTTFQSSVPAYPVRVVIDTHVGSFVHFQPTAINTYVVATTGGIFYNNQFISLPDATTYCGYGGVVVYINMMGGYDAYDLACPNCAGKGLKAPCEVDGIFAVCPHCGEHYDLGSGTSAPQKGLAREYMRRLNVMNSDGKLTITQRQ